MCLGVRVVRRHVGEFRAVVAARDQLVGNHEAARLRKARREPTRPLLGSAPLHLGLRVADHHDLVATLECALDHQLVAAMQGRELADHEAAPEKWLVQSAAPGRSDVYCTILSPKSRTRSISRL